MIRNTPEALGIPSKSLSRLIQRLDSFDIPFHSLLVARHGQLALEAYYTPYDANTKHRLFSVSKSFTSIAIGLLCEEGKLSLNDPIVSYFADMLPANPHPYLTAMTIENMLSMETCHSSTTYKTLIEQGQIGESSSPIKDRQSTNKENLWVKSFFHHSANT